MKPLLLALALTLPVLGSDAVLQWNPVDAGGAPVKYNVYRADMGTTNWVLMTSTTSTNWAFSGTNCAQLTVSTQYNWPNVAGSQPESVKGQPVIFYPDLPSITGVRVIIIVNP